jgi:putative lipoic acid-binding regulatory protein
MIHGTLGPEHTEHVMDTRPSEDLLESHHAFPGVYHIKAIGSLDDDFPARVVAAALTELAGPSEIEHVVRETKGGRHASVSLDITVQSAEQVRAIYERIREVEGLTLLL